MVSVGMKGVLVSVENTEKTKKKKRKWTQRNRNNLVELNLWHI